MLRITSVAPLFFFLVFVVKDSLLASNLGSRTLSVQKLGNRGVVQHDKNSDFMLAKSIEIQRRAFLAIIQPYLNRPEEETAAAIATDDDDDGLSNTIPNPVRPHLDEDSSIHLRVLRNANTSQRPSLELSGGSTRAKQPDNQLNISQAVIVHLSNNSSNITHRHKVSTDHVSMVERRSIPQFGGMVSEIKYPRGTVYANQPAAPTPLRKLVRLGRNGADSRRDRPMLHDARQVLRRSGKGALPPGVPEALHRPLRLALGGRTQTSLLP